MDYTISIRQSLKKSLIFREEEKFDAMKLVLPMIIRFITFLKEHRLFRYFYNPHKSY